MKTTVGIIIAAALGFAAPASADTIATFTLDNVTFDDGGTANGSFTMDLTTATLSNINITTSNDGAFGVTYIGGSGGPFGSTNFTNNPASFEFDLFAFVYESDLIINLANGLTPADLATPDSFSISSGSEGAISLGCPGFFCGSRNIVSGSLDTGELAATPLPATLPLLAGGLGVLGFVGKRRKRKAASSLAAA